MESRYDESAKRLAAQKKQRMRVTRRRKIVNNLTAGALVVGLSVGFAFMFVNAWDKEFEANQQMVAEYRAENYRPQISDEEKAQADKEYVEDHYSAQTIDGLKASTINEYGHLIDAIVDNEKLQVTSNIESLDSNRLDDTIVDYGEFKESCEQDKVDYANVSEEDRISRASELYNVKQEVLERELTEAKQKSKYLTPDTPEYIANQEQIENINHQINTIISAMEVVSDRGMIVYLEQQKEDGKQR